MSIAERNASLPSGRSADQRSIVDQVRSKNGAWTVEELATFLSISTKLLYKLIKAGKLNAYRFGTAFRIDGKDAAEYMTAHSTIPPTICG